MRKPGIVIFVFVFLISSITLSAAAPEQSIQHAEKAEILKNLGLFRGNNNGFELERAPNRLEAGVMLVRLLGKEQEALSLKHKHPFTDVPDWANDYIGFMYNQGYTKGIGNNLYGSNDLTTVQSYITFVLRALGYSEANGDFTWEKCFDKAVEIGLVSQQTRSSLENKTFLRDDMVGLSYDALSMTLKGTDTKLIEKLVDDGAVPYEIAVQEGFIAEQQNSGLATVQLVNFDKSANVYTFFIDRATLPKEMRHFYKVTTGGLQDSDESILQMAILNDDRSNRTAGHFQSANPYDDEKGQVSRFYEFTCLTLFDQEGNRLGTALFSGAQEGTFQVAFKNLPKYPEDYDAVMEQLKKLSTLDTGIMYARDDLQRTYMYIDRTLLPEEVRRFDGFMAFTGDERPIEESMYLILKSKNPFSYSPNEVFSFPDQYMYTYIVLFSEGKPIGYKLLDKNTPSAQPVKLVYIQLDTPYSEQKPGPMDFTVKRYINGEPDESFNSRSYSFGTQDIIKEIRPQNEHEEFKVEKEGIRVHLGPYVKFDDSVTFEVTSNTVEIKSINIVPLN